jgi:hypothetical protein
MAPLNRVYTERFLIATGNLVHTRWTCPVAKRAVITSFLAGSDAAGGGAAQVFVAGRFAGTVGVTGANQTLGIQCRVALYQHEQLDVYTLNSSLAVTVGGYLFDDQSGAVGPPGRVDLERETAPTPLPSSSG